jgi:hypothetical protein
MKKFICAIVILVIFLGVFLNPRQSSAASVTDMYVVKKELYARPKTFAKRLDCLVRKVFVF